jgi:hypothetical protein
LAQALIILTESPARVAKMGQQARAMLDDHFARRHAPGRWHQLLAPMLRPN